MQSSLPNGLGQSCVILGAGATRGSTLAVGGTRPLPPLDSDFFTQVQRVKNAKYTKYISKLTNYCHREFGPDWDLSMEGFFNHIWYSRTFANRHNVKLGGRRTTKRDQNGDPIWKKMTIDIQDLFKQVLLGTLEESLFGHHSTNIFTASCHYHDLISQSLSPFDSVISFNYDCVADVSMALHCATWNPMKSYGFAPSDAHNADYWNPNSRSHRGRPTRLLKMHGSINWQQSAGGIKLMQRPYTRQNADRKFFIVPPVLSKENWIIEELQSVWSEAVDALQRADSIIIIGYSLPDADALSSAMLRTRAQSTRHTKRRELRNLVIANPDKSVRGRIRGAMRQSIGPNTRVLSFKSLGEFCECVLKTPD